MLSTEPNASVIVEMALYRFNLWTFDFNSTDTNVEPWDLAVAPEVSKRMFRHIYLCFLRSRVLIFHLSISSHAFDSRPPAAFVFETNLSILSIFHEILLSTFSRDPALDFFNGQTDKKSMVGQFRTLDLRVSSRLLTPKTNMSWRHHYSSLSELIQQ